jgi:hypothetical protein
VLGVRLHQRPENGLGGDGLRPRCDRQRIPAGDLPLSLSDPGGAQFDEPLLGQDIGPHAQDQFRQADAPESHGGRVGPEAALLVQPSRQELDDRHSRHSSSKSGCPE